MFTKCKAVFDMKKDFEETFKVSTHISEKYNNLSPVRNIVDSILRLFAPLL